MLEGFDPNTIRDKKARQSLIILLNLVETLQAEHERLWAENQRLRDKITRLKGEQGKPPFKGKQTQEDLHRPQSARV